MEANTEVVYIAKLKSGGVATPLGFGLIPDNFAGVLIVTIKFKLDRVM